jgi:Tfp pilus assembly protein PilW
MSDEVLNIRVTEAELDLITLLLEQAGTMEDSNGQPAFELLHDLMEQAARPGDWTEDLEPTDLNGRTFSVAESDFIDHGIRAREMAKTQKATSMAADRRTQRFGEFSVNKPDERSEQQGVDVWDANDPKNW